MQPSLDALLAKRRDRAIAIILGVKERECDMRLSHEQSNKLRKVVLDQLNEFYDIVVDVMKSFDSDDIVMNDMYLNKLDQVHEGVKAIHRSLGKSNASV
jgi:hypothetical protein